MISSAQRARGGDIKKNTKTTSRKIGFNHADNLHGTNTKYSQTFTFNLIKFIAR